MHNQIPVYSFVLRKGHLLQNQVSKGWVVSTAWKSKLFLVAQAEFLNTGVLKLNSKLFFKILIFLCQTNCSLEQGYLHWVSFRKESLTAFFFLLFPSALSNLTWTKVQVKHYTKLKICQAQKIMLTSCMKMYKKCTLTLSFLLFKS